MFFVKHFIESISCTICTICFIETLCPYQFIASNLSFQNVVDSFSPLLEFNSMATTWCLPSTSTEHHLAEASPPFEARSALFLEIWGLRRLVA